MPKSKSKYHDARLADFLEEWYDGKIMVISKKELDKLYDVADTNSLCKRCGCCPTCGVDATDSA